MKLEIMEFNKINFVAFTLLWTYKQIYRCITTPTHGPRYTPHLCKFTPSIPTPIQSYMHSNSFTKQTTENLSQNEPQSTTMWDTTITAPCIRAIKTSPLGIKYLSLY